MKTRKGFISNSSSTSFCIMGAHIGDCKWEEAENLLEKFDDVKLEVNSGCNEYDDSTYVGLDVDRMKDNETLLEFRTRVFEQIKKIYPDTELKAVGWVVDGGYNG